MEETFNDYRPLLFHIAYRMLGSVMDAEDMVQETFLRWRDVDPETVNTPKSYLTTIITRLCIDHLRSAQVQRENYIGPWLPEPLLADTHPGVAERVAQIDSLSIAFLLLMESLSPAQRAAFVLRQGFGYKYGEIAEILDTSPANGRQLVSRARRKLEQASEEKRPFLPATSSKMVPSSEGKALLGEFIEACGRGDVNHLLNILAEDAVVVSDGGGKVSAARRPVRGADRVARFMVGLAAQAPADFDYEVRLANGAWSMIAYAGAHPFAVFVPHIGDGRIHALHIIVNPDKLTYIPQK